MSSTLPSPFLIAISVRSTSTTSDMSAPYLATSALPVSSLRCSDDGREVAAVVQDARLLEPALRLGAVEALGNSRFTRRLNFMRPTADRS